jgi:hypothetical protein
MAIITASRDETVQDDEPHRRLPRACLGRHLEGDDGVQPHAGRERDGEVRTQSHQQRAERGGGRRRGGHGLEWQARRREDRRVGDQDVRHRPERGDAAANLACHAGATSMKVETSHRRQAAQCI